jgi:hypothetical protein
MSPLWENGLDFAGALVEVVGALFLANRYLSKADFFQVPGALISAFFRGRSGRAMELMGEASKEDGIVSLRGILLLIVGFLVRSSPHFVFLVSHFLSAAPRQ